MSKMLCGMGSIFYPLVSGISCGQPPDVPNATFTLEGLFYEDIAFYSCDPGFEVSDGVADWNITCQSDDTWSAGSSCSSKERCYRLCPYQALHFIALIKSQETNYNKLHKPLL